MKIDRLKLKAAIKAHEANPTDAHYDYTIEKLPTGGTRVKFDYSKRIVGLIVIPRPNGVFNRFEYYASRATTLYCIAAHSRGRLHMTKLRVPLNDASGRTEVIPFTMEMQERLIGELWKEFEAEAPSEKIAV